MTLPIFLIAQEHIQQQDTINGIYIPTDLEDSFKQINSFWDDSTKAMVSNWTEDEFSAKAHMGFGLWMRNNWRLWGGSRLSKYFNDLGIYHPDDMSGIILTSYHRQLVGKEIELKKQIKNYKDYWKKSEKESQKQDRKDFKVFDVGDTVEFNYNFGFISEEQEALSDKDSCWAKGIILDKKSRTLELQIKLIDACDPTQSIVSLKYDQYDQETEELIERNLTETMKVGEVEWMYFTLWDY